MPFPLVHTLEGLGDLYLFEIHLTILKCSLTALPHVHGEAKSRCLYNTMCYSRAHYLIMLGGAWTPVA